MRADLALDPLQRVVDGLGVAGEALAHLLVGVAVEIQREHATLQLGQGAREAAHQRAQLLGGDDLVDGIVHGGAWQHLVERGHVFAGSGRCGGEGHVLVQRRVLVARGRLHGSDDLARDAQLGKVAEAGLAIGAKVADRLVQTHEPLLDEVIGVAPGQEVRGGLQPHEAVVAPHEAVIGVAVAELRQRDEEYILNLRFSLRAVEVSCHEQILSCDCPTTGEQAAKSPSGAHLPRRQSVPKVVNLRFSVMLRASLPQLRGVVNPRGRGSARSHTAARRRRR